VINRLLGLVLLELADLLTTSTTASILFYKLTALFVAKLYYNVTLFYIIIHQIIADVVLAIRI